MGGRGGRNVRWVRRKTGEGYEVRSVCAHSDDDFQCVPTCASCSNEIFLDVIFKKNARPLVLDLHIFPLLTDNQEVKWLPVGSWEGGQKGARESRIWLEGGREGWGGSGWNGRGDRWGGGIEGGRSGRPAGGAGSGEEGPRGDGRRWGRGRREGDMGGRAG